MVNLKKAKLKKNVLLDLFKSLVRPILDYCAVVYGPMLTAEQSEMLERLQRQTLKLIFGFNIPYADLIEKNDITTLSQRRQELLDKFVVSNLDNEKFTGQWFPLKEEHHYPTRHEKKYVEKPTRTCRLRNSPLYTMRRRANQMCQSHRLTRT